MTLPTDKALPYCRQEDAEVILVEEYAKQGFGSVHPTFQSITTLWGKVDVYLFAVDVGTAGANEFAAIVIDNGAFMRLRALPDGDFEAYSGVF